MNQKEQEIFDEILGQTISGQASATPAGQMNQLKAILQAMDGGLMQLSQSVQILGQGLDLTQLKINMIMNVLVDKGIVTKEEIEERFKKDVTENLKKMREKQEQEIQQKLQEIEEKSEVKTREIKEEDCSDCENCTCDKESDVVLPSERSEKVVFK